MNSSDLTHDELRKILTDGDFEYIFRTAMDLYYSLNSVKFELSLCEHAKNKAQMENNKLEAENARLREIALAWENRKEQAEIELVKYKKAIKAAKEEAHLQIVYYGEKFRAALNKLGG